MFAEATRIHKYIEDPQIYGIYDMDIKTYLKNTNKAAENGVIVLVAEDVQ